MKRIPRRIFREEFKREAIKLVNEQGLSIAAARFKFAGRIDGIISITNFN
jgi:transposase-like protein